MTKETRIYNGEKTTSSISGAGKSGLLQVKKKKRKKLECYLMPRTKINSKWIKDINVRQDTVQLLKENMGKALFDINSYKIFFDPPPRVWTRKKFLGIHLGLLPTKFRQIHREVSLGGSTVEWREHEWSDFEFGLHHSLAWCVCRENRCVNVNDKEMRHNVNNYWVWANSLWAFFIPSQFFCKFEIMSK